MSPEELRRSHRYSDFLPISICIRKKEDLSLVAGPLSARIIDVSNHGACLVLTKVVVQSYHIFHSPKGDDSVVLGLDITLPSVKKPIEILSHPVWMNTSSLDDIKIFKLGVDFTSEIDDELMLLINKYIQK